VGINVDVGVSVGVGENVGVGTGVGVEPVQPIPTIAARSTAGIRIRIRIMGLTPQLQKPIRMGAAINTGDRTNCQIE